MVLKSFVQNFLAKQEVDGLGQNPRNFSTWLDLRVQNDGGKIQYQGIPKKLHDAYSNNMINLTHLTVLEDINHLLLITTWLISWSSTNLEYIPHLIRILYKYINHYMKQVDIISTTKMQNSDSIVSLQDKQKYHLLEMQDSESRVSLSNEQKKQVQLLLNELEGQRKRRKNMSRCRKSVIYSYKFCRCCKFYFHSIFKLNY